MNNELTTKTPIEIALGMTEDGMVSAKSLYAFLELAPTQYARWCKDNILDNPLVDENVDFKPFRHDVENPLGGRPSDDYLLTIEFAKELCMSCHTDKGRLARDYFKKTEKALVITIKDFNDFKQQVLNQYNSLQIKQDETVKLIESRLDLLESKSEIMLDKDTDWAMEMMEHVRKIADTYKYVDTAKCMDRLIERAERYLGGPYKNYEADYAIRHNGKKGKKIFVMARDEDSRSAFEQAVKDFEIERGIYEQNEGQRYVEKIMDGMGEMIVPDPPAYYHEPTDEELAAQWKDMDKMYGPGWDAPQNYPPEGIYGD